MDSGGLEAEEEQVAEQLARTRDTAARAGGTCRGEGRCSSWPTTRASSTSSDRCNLPVERRNRETILPFSTTCIIEAGTGKAGAFLCHAGASSGQAAPARPGLLLTLTPV